VWEGGGNWGKKRFWVGGTQFEGQGGKKKRGPGLGGGRGHVYLWGGGGDVVRGEKRLKGGGVFDVV